MPTVRELWTAYWLRLRRRRLLWRAFRARHQLRRVADRSQSIRRGDILAFATVRNEIERLPFFLAHYRRLGVDHFLFVDNASTDGTRELLAAQPDVSLWSSSASYKRSRFGVDWLGWLLIRHGHGHWCLTLDADEILIYPHHDTRPLRALTEWLDENKVAAFGAMMLDMYPEGPLNAQVYEPGSDPFEILGWFDAGNYSARIQPMLQNLWLQGGVRTRCFFADNPRASPTLDKTPLVKWHRRYAYVNSTHTMLPRRLNRTYEQGGGERASGVLLHTKFLHTIVERSREEKARGEHFGRPAAFDHYYDGLVANPVLWCARSTRYTGWRQLEARGLMSRGGWV
jgi:hypothetical protein